MDPCGLISNKDDDDDNTMPHDIKMHKSKIQRDSPCTQQIVKLYRFLYL